VGHLESTGQTDVIELRFIVLIGKDRLPDRYENNITTYDRSRK